MLVNLSAIIISSFLSLFCSLAKATPNLRKLQSLTIIPRADPGSSDVSIDSLSYTGSGYRFQDDVTVRFASDSRNRIEIGYRSLYAYAGTIPPIPSNTECEVTFIVKHPVKWALGLGSHSTGDIHGVLDLEAPHNASVTKELQYGNTESQKWLVRASRMGGIYCLSVFF